MGRLRLAPDTRQAWLDDIAFWLGFAPLESNGHCLVHELDLRKNLEPLLAPALSATTTRTVVIDPGHGGENSGTRSVLPHLLEKHLTLDWALRLEPLLRQQGWHVILTRATDVDVSLAERVAVAERAGADLFVSLHFNSAFPQTDLKGPETYCLTPAGMPSTLTRNYEDDASRVFPNNRHDDQNLLYAFRLHRALVEASGGPDRGLRRARFMGVLRGQNRPAVLLEAGYLSNPEEAQRIASQDYRQRLAEAVARALPPTPSLALERPPGRRSSGSTP